MTLGERIRQRREEKGISAVELARQARISKGYVSELESGRAARPSGTILFRIANVLGTTVADLLGEEIRPANASIPAALRTFAEDAQLPEEDVRMLAQIQFRGEQPQNADDWRFL